MCWCWNHEAVSLFRRIDDTLFDKLDNSPIKLISTVGQERLDQLLRDDGFLAHLDRVVSAQDKYMNQKTWFQETYGRDSASDEELVKRYRMAYFSAEFGIHESVPIYSGGLGLLAGDHLKSASDLGLPLVGVGLMYREGYFRQYLNVDGWQQERYPENDFYNLPLISENKADGTPLIVGVPMPGREVTCRVWRIQVGRIPLYLLDTNIPQNTPDDRTITARLYGGDHDMRIRQEMVLGIGGFRALRALGKNPAVCHMNEGHSAFCGLERVRVLMEENDLDFATAREAVTAGTCFTTHTPVPAGNDVFSPQLIQHYFGSYLPVAQDRLDRVPRPGPAERPRQRRAVLHDRARPQAGERLATASAPCTASCRGRCGRRSGPSCPKRKSRSRRSPTASTPAPGWLPKSGSSTTATSACSGTIGRPITASGNASRTSPTPSSGEPTNAAANASSSSPAIACKMQLERRGAPPSEIAKADEVLDPETLTIGFARRFATYKRGTLIFRNLDRLTSILNNKDRPVQFVFAGKAHPRDHGGKELIAEIIHVCRRPELRRKMVFIEDYEINVARYLVQGVDVWLNNPRRPLEASGTVGHEGLRQRRPQHVDPRRLVVRRLHRRQRLGDRRRRGVHRPQLPGRHREPSSSTTSSSRRSPRSSTPAATTACRAAG